MLCIFHVNKWMLYNYMNSTLNKQVSFPVNILVFGNILENVSVVPI